MSFDFTTLVTDRTQSDVQRVRSVAAKIINGTASAAEIAEWNAANMKGAYNYTDLNRVTAAIEALKSTLDGYGYSVPGYKRIEIPRGDGARLPEGHTELKWIESSGTQYIDTGFKPNQNSRAVVDAEFTNIGDGKYIFGARAAWQNAMFAVYGEADGTQFTYGHGTQTGKASGTVISRHVFDLDKNSLYIDGALGGTLTANNFQSASNLYLFSCSQNGSPLNYTPYLKIYSCKIYDNGTLVRDYAPSMTEDGQVGLYDLVEGKFYPNAGTGSFIAVPVVELDHLPGGDDTEKDPYLWYETDIPTPALMAAYLANVSAIRSVLDMLPTTPAVPADMEQLTTDKANAIERILADINTLIQNMIAAWFYSGEIYSGEV